MEWDADNFEPPKPVIPVEIVGGAKLNKWEGEDEEENIKDSWDAEDVEPKKTETKVPEKKTKSKLEQKIAERERRQKIENDKIRRKFLEAEENSNMTPEEKKLLQQKLQEEADLEVAKEMLGVDEGDEDSIDRMQPKSKEDFALFEQALQKKIQSVSKSEHYSEFIEELIRNLSVSLSMNDLRKVKATVDNMSIEKMKAEKGDKSKKNKGKAKAKLRLDNSSIQNYDEFSAYTVDDDFDEFM
ncbi:eukaryotic translation initiation factor 3 subunit J [Adelges cooleyi]|uniref:eukaryotic translation initiation factor 3 subunit J n=1 Tax=Adelges cooleyi TaxID=133065 RepID=UPI00217FC188|nr:eukaryotic translation initiation factor 3 subunit J [Adelges cooleyi]